MQIGGLEVHDTKKGKYTPEENNQIISTINQKLAEGKKERDVLKELSIDLNRGYAGIMSHVRKLRSEFPDRFNSSDDSNEGLPRLNSWEEREEILVIDTVNQFLKDDKSLSAAIVALEKELSRTQGAIYQRIYTLRRKYPEKFDHLPVQRPRRRRKYRDWQISQPVIHPLDEHSFHAQSSRSESTSVGEQQLNQASEHLLKLNQDIPELNQDIPVTQQMWTEKNPSLTTPTTAEEEMLTKAFEDRYGRLNPDMKHKLIQMMRMYGCTHVTIALFTLNEDKSFPSIIVEFLERRLQNHKFL